jgi:hypothetical protein
MAKEGRGEELPLLAAMRCQQISDMREGGGMRGCRELPGNGRNMEKKKAAVSCPEVPEIGRNGGKTKAAVSFH